jgi:hypothetical protein
MNLFTKFKLFFLKIKPSSWEEYMDWFYGLKNLKGNSVKNKDVFLKKRVELKKKLNANTVEDAKLYDLDNDERPENIQDLDSIKYTNTIDSNVPINVSGINRVFTAEEDKHLLFRS